MVKRINASANLRQPSADGVSVAAAVLIGIAVETPLLPLEIHGETVWIKAECLQRTGSFKLRGAWHRLSALSPAERAAGVVAFSSGNHAQGVAWAGRRLGIAAAIVMPRDAPAAKLAATRALGAEIILYDRAGESREAIAAKLAADRGATLVPSFDDPWIIEGQGTVGLEAARQMEAAGVGPARIVVPCGGGGLSAGIALAVPAAQLVVVEPEGWDDMGESLRRGAIVPVGPQPPPTACDALQTLRVSPLTFAVLRERQARGVTASEAEIAGAMRHAFAELHVVAEPGGAVALAAMLAGTLPPQPGTLVILSGGNVDPARYAAALTA